MMSMNTPMMESLPGETAGWNGEDPGLKGMGIGMKEWIIPLKPDTFPHESNDKSGSNLLPVPLMEIVPGTGSASTEKKVLEGFRYPWEGFPDVGFRCVVSEDQVARVR
jgi:hypothetical protein